MRRMFRQQSLRLCASVVIARTVGILGFVWGVGAVGVVGAVGAVGVSFVPAAAHAGEVNVAVASNFTAPMKLITDAFEKETGHSVALAFGGSGQFYAQIRSGAPFAVLLSADAAIPARLQEEGLAVANTTFTYATGKLVLWSADPERVDESAQILKSGQFKRIAIANPKLAPYGQAAMQVLENLNLVSAVKSRIVEGANIGQTFQFVSSGNAEIGFVALAQVIENGTIKAGSGWIVPEQMHSPIRQDAVLLQTGQDNPAALALMAYLRSDKAREIIRSYGYATQ